MSDTTPPKYLSMMEQDRVMGEIRYKTFTQPWQGKMFFTNGSVFALGTLLASGSVFWRCAFRGFNLARFGRRRIGTALMPVMGAAAGATTHDPLVKDALNNMFRKENQWTYGLRSALAHQPGLFVTFFIVTTYTFVAAHDMGILDTPKFLFRKGMRSEAWKLYFTKLKPYTRSIAYVWAGSSMLMFLVGCREYRESKHILASINRKTLGLREN